MIMKVIIMRVTVKTALKALIKNFKSISSLKKDVNWSALRSWTPSRVSESKPQTN